MLKPLISVVVILYNSKESLGGAIEAINKSDYPNIEVIVVDNASTEKVDRKEINCRFETQFHQLEANIGFGRGCNFGAEKASGEYILFLNPDARPMEDAISILVDCLIRNSEAAAVGPQLLNPEGIPMPSYRFTPDFGRLLFSTHSPLSKFKLFSKYTRRYIAPLLKELSEVEVIPATSMLVRYSAFVEVGGFDKRYFMYAEDFDLCVMLRRAGYKVLHQPAAKVYHDWGKGSKVSKSKLKALHNRSIHSFYKKHYPNNRIRSFILLLLLKLRLLPEYRKRNH
ncbi:MAG: glycosyltransferase [candidate division Zixibacteria bacterium]|nr:glycosyltransferase [candidate division Zixibacteria bacterium]